MPLTVRYQFSQPFPVSVKKAFDWCTNFSEEDHLLMGEKNALRQITHISEDMIILKDVFPLLKGSVEKEKLVTLYPEQLLWVSTHLTGPNKHSQFFYQILPINQLFSELSFTALHLEYDEKADAKLLAKQLSSEDAGAWKLLAKAMANEIANKC